MTKTGADPLAWNTKKEDILRGVVAETLGIDGDEVTEDIGPENTAAWTSFVHLTLMSAVEERFGIQMTMDEMTSVKRVGDLKSVIESYTG